MEDSAVTRGTSRGTQAGIITGILLFISFAIAMFTPPHDRTLIAFYRGHEAVFVTELLLAPIASLLFLWLLAGAGRFFGGGGGMPSGAATLVVLCGMTFVVLFLVGDVLRLIYPLELDLVKPGPLPGVLVARLLEHIGLLLFAYAAIACALLVAVIGVMFWRAMPRQSVLAWSSLGVALGLVVIDFFYALFSLALFAAWITVVSSFWARLRS